jgi:hypothetical protein
MTTQPTALAASLAHDYLHDHLDPAVADRVAFRDVAVILHETMTALAAAGWLTVRHDRRTTDAAEPEPCPHRCGGNGRRLDASHAINCPMFADVAVADDKAGRMLALVDDLDAIPRSEVGIILGNWLAKAPASIVRDTMRRLMAAGRLTGDEVDAWDAMVTRPPIVEAVETLAIADAYDLVERVARYAVTPGAVDPQGIAYAGNVVLDAVINARDEQDVAGLTPEAAVTDAMEVINADPMAALTPPVPSDVLNAGHRLADAVIKAVHPVGRGVPSAELFDLAGDWRRAAADLGAPSASPPAELVVMAEPRKPGIKRLALVDLDALADAANALRPDGPASDAMRVDLANELTSLVRAVDQGTAAYYEDRRTFIAGAAIVPRCQPTEPTPHLDALLDFVEHAMTTGTPGHELARAADDALQALRPERAHGGAQRARKVTQVGPTPTEQTTSALRLPPPLLLAAIDVAGAGQRLYDYIVRPAAPMALLPPGQEVCRLFAEAFAGWEAAYDDARTTPPTAPDGYWPVRMTGRDALTLNALADFLVNREEAVDVTYAQAFDREAGGTPGIASFLRMLGAIPHDLPDDLIVSRSWLDTEAHRLDTVVAELDLNRTLRMGLAGTVSEVAHALREVIGR